MAEEARLKGKLTLDDSQFEAALRRSATNAAKFAGSVGRTVGAGAAVGFATLTTAAAGASIALANATKRALDLGGQFADMRAMTGASVKSLSLLSQAFDDAGIGGENVAATLNKMQKSIEAGGDAFRDLGIDLEKLKRLSPEEQFAQIGNAIAALKTPSQQTAAAMEIFGKSGGKLLTFFKDSAALENAKTVLGSMPEILDKNAEKFDAMSDKIGNMTKKWDAFGVGFADKIAPALDPILDKLLAIDTAKIGQGLGADIASAFNGKEASAGILDLGAKLLTTLTAVAKAGAAILAASLAEAFRDPLAEFQARIEATAAYFSQIGDKDSAAANNEAFKNNQRQVESLTADLNEIERRKPGGGAKKNAFGWLGGPEMSNELSPDQYNSQKAATAEALQAALGRMNEANNKLNANPFQGVAERKAEILANGGPRLGFGDGQTPQQIIEGAMAGLKSEAGKAMPATASAVTSQIPKAIAAGKPMPTGFDAASPAYKAQLIGFYGSEEAARKQFDSPPAAAARETPEESPMRQPSVKGADGVRATVGRVERKNKILSGEALKKAKDAEAAAKAQMSTAEGVNKIATILEGK